MSGGSTLKDAVREGISSGAVEMQVAKLKAGSRRVGPRKGWFMLLLETKRRVRGVY